MAGQLINACVQLALGILLFIAGNRIANWISARDTLRREVDRHDLEIDRTAGAIRRIEARLRMVETTIRD